MWWPSPSNRSPFFMALPQASAWAVHVHLPGWQLQRPGGPPCGRWRLWDVRQWPRDLLTVWLILVDVGWCWWMLMRVQRQPRTRPNFEVQSNDVQRSRMATVRPKSKGSGGWNWSAKIVGRGWFLRMLPCFSSYPKIKRVVSHWYLIDISLISHDISWYFPKSQRPCKTFKHGAWDAPDRQYSYMDLRSRTTTIKRKTRTRTRPWDAWRLERFGCAKPSHKMVALWWWNRKIIERWCF